MNVFQLSKTHLVLHDRIYSSGEWLTHEFNIIDTGGIEIGDAPFQTQIRAQS